MSASPQALPTCEKCQRRKIEREVVVSTDGAIRIETGTYCGCDWPWPVGGVDPRPVRAATPDGSIILPSAQRTVEENEAAKAGAPLVAGEPLPEREDPRSEMIEFIDEQHCRTPEELRQVLWQAALSFDASMSEAVDVANHYREQGRLS